MTAKTICDNCNEFLKDHAQNWELRDTSSVRMYISEVPDELHLCADCAKKLLAPVFVKFTKASK
jgi:hypothetical protein